MGYETTIQQTKQLSEKSKLVRPTYVKVRFANSRDWAKWKINTRGYMTSLQIPNILSASYEAPTKEIFEYAIYVIVLTESRAVKAWGLRLIRDGNGTPGLT
jgi:cytochrome c oxidase assembly protein Cox11